MRLLKMSESKIYFKTAQAVSVCGGVELQVLQTDSHHVTISGQSRVMYCTA